MKTETQLTVDEISKRILAGVGFVQDLIEEIGNLLWMIQESIDAAGLKPRVLTRRLPASRKKFGKLARKYLDTHKAFIAQIGVGEDVGEDVVEEEDYDENGEEREGEEKRRGVQVAPDSKFLVVIVRFYEPNEFKAKNFQPYVVGSIIERVTIKPKATKSKDKPLKEKTSFQIKKHDLLMPFWDLDKSSKAKGNIQATVRGNILSAQIRGIETRLLGEFNSEESVRNFAGALIKMAEKTKQ